MINTHLECVLFNSVKILLNSIAATAINFVVAIRAKGWAFPNDWHTVGHKSFFFPRIKNNAISMKADDLGSILVSKEFWYLIDDLS